MKIQILSMIEEEWKIVEKNAKEALKKLNIDGEIEIVNDAFYLMACGILTTPIFVVNGHIKSKGKVINCDDIVQILNNC